MSQNNPNFWLWTCIAVVYHWGTKGEDECKLNRRSDRKYKERVTELELHLDGHIGSHFFRSINSPSLWNILYEKTPMWKNSRQHSKGYCAFSDEAFLDISDRMKCSRGTAVQITTYPDFIDRNKLNMNPYEIRVNSEEIVRTWCVPLPWWLVSFMKPPSGPSRVRKK